MKMNYIPVTHLSSYLYCPIKLFIEQVLKIRKIDESKIIISKIKHELYDKIAKNEENFVKRLDKIESKEKLLERYRLQFNFHIRNSILNNSNKLENANVQPMTVFVQLKKNFETESIKRTQNIYDNFMKTNALGNDLWRLLNPKIISEKELKSKEFKLIGRVDRIEKWNDKNVPVELKNSKHDHVFDSQKIQIGAYILLCNNLNGNRSKYGYIQNIFNDSRKLIIMNDFLESEIVKVRDNVISVLESKDAKKVIECKVSEKKCLVCNYRDNCWKLKSENRS